MGRDTPANAVGTLRLLRRSGAVSVAAALLALAVVIPVSAHAADGPLVVRTSIAPSVKFGDPVETRVTVAARPDVIDVASIRVTAPLAPLARLAPTRVSRVRRGPVEVLAFDVTAACFEQRCVAAKGPAVLRLPRVTVTAHAANGDELTASERWPDLTVLGRVPAGISASTGHFRTDVDPPPVSYRLSPGLLSALLLLAASALAVTGIAIAFVRAARLLRRRHEVPVTELERALALAREAERRSPADRRRAVGLLARILGPREPELAGEASALAWSRPEPTSQSVSGLVDDVGRTVGTR